MIATAEAKLRPVSAPEKAPPRQTYITVRGLSKRFGESPLYENFDLDLPQGRVTSIFAFVITASEGGQLHLPNLKTRRADFDPLTRDRLTAGALVPAAWYLQAQRLRRSFAARVREVFEDFDVLLAPATPMAATPLGQEMFSIRKRELPLRPNMGMLTQPLSFIGLPVAVAPLAGAGRLPLGVQIVAPAWREDLCLRVAAAMEAGGLACCGEPLTGALAA